MDKALRASDELEKVLVMRIEHEYGKETLKAIGDLKGFFRDVEALERKKPPVWMDEAAQKRWKRRELDALVQKHRVESRVMKAIRTAGAIAAPLIWDFLARVYGENASQTVEEAQKAQAQQGLAQNAALGQAEPAQSTAPQQPQQNFVPQRQRKSCSMTSSRPLARSPLTIWNRPRRWSGGYGPRCGRPSLTGKGRTRYASASSG